MKSNHLQAKTNTLLNKKPDYFKALSIYMSLVKLIELKECRGKQDDFIAEDAGPTVDGLPLVCHVPSHQHPSQPLIHSLAIHSSPATNWVLKSMVGYESSHVEVILIHYLLVCNSRLGLWATCALDIKGGNISLMEINQHRDAM